MERPSKRLVEQRIRNGMIEYFELASSFDAQIEYEASTIADVPTEVIELWADNNPVDQARWPGRLAEPYSEDEIDAMVAFHREWEWVVAHTPNRLPALAELQRTREWQRLREAAEAALRAFVARGRLPEDREV